MENKRLIEDNHIFNEELKVANEFKWESNKIVDQLKKCESKHRKFMADIFREKNMIKVSFINKRNNLII